VPPDRHPQHRAGGEQNGPGDYDQATYDAIVADYAEFAKGIGIESFTALPISGFKGDNITALSANTPWYKGPTLVEHLETVEVLSSLDADKPFRLPVQWVNRPNLDFRGFSGLIATGRVKPGDEVRVLPSGKTSTVTRVVTLDGDLDQAVAASQSQSALRTRSTARAAMSSPPPPIRRRPPTSSKQRWCG
jgi:sulfate adenylyltransferase subunit 1 (EFTu-like GTPase family)